MAVKKVGCGKCPPPHNPPPPIYAFIVASAITAKPGPEQLVGIEGEFERLIKSWSGANFRGTGVCYLETWVKF